jgi:hypothetical protein
VQLSSIKGVSISKKSLNIHPAGMEHSRACPILLHFACKCIPGWLMKRGAHTIFNTVLQLQRFPRLITHRKRDIFQLILLVRDMFACITICLALASFPHSFIVFSPQSPCASCTHSSSPFPLLSFPLRTENKRTKTHMLLFKQLTGILAP